MALSQLSINQCDSTRLECCFWGHQFNVCTLGRCQRADGGRGNTTCLQQSVTNGWVLKRKNKTNIIHRFLHHISSYFASGLLSLAHFNGDAVPCRIPYAFCRIWPLIARISVRQFRWNICRLLITRGNFKIDSLPYAQHSNELLLCQRLLRLRKSTADVTRRSVYECVYRN